MNYDIETLIKERQSCRNYKNKPIERALLLNIIGLARLSPSACNSQPWKFHLIINEQAKKFAPCVQDMGSNKFASDCPAFIAIEQTTPNLPERIGSNLLSSNFAHNDIGIVAGFITLIAKGYGVDSCILGWRNQSKINEFLNLPKNAKIPLIIALGYKSDDDTLREKKRKPIDSILQIYE